MTKKILFVTYKLQNYRIPIFNIIGAKEGIELTVLHSDKLSESKNKAFKELTIPYKKIGPLTFYDKSFRELIKSYDVVVCMFYLQNMSFFRLILSRKRSFKLIFWGIGVRASYESNFDEPTFFNRIRSFWAKKSDAMIFYTQYAKDKYIREGFSANKLFVMHNTVEVNNYKEDVSLRKDLLFVGTLYKSKKIFELLEAYEFAKKSTPKMPKLNIVGKGDEFDNIKKWIENTNNKDNIILHGAIYDEDILEKMFTTSIACFSPGQAGLSVLKSFGYGVPFITHENAITGGERLNIIDGVNGILFKKDDDLKDILIDISLNPSKFVTMGENAKKFYDNERTPENMANGFIDAVDYTLNLKTK